jgi:hypothetical protein
MHTPTCTSFDWDHLPLVIATVSLFGVHLHFEPTDLHLWDPFPSVLGIALGASFKKIWYSADRGWIRGLWNDAWSIAPETEEMPLMNRDGGPAAED